MKQLVSIVWVLVVAVLAGCGGGEPPAENKPAPPTPDPPRAYVRPKLSDAAVLEYMYYPLDTCVVSGRPLTPTSHSEEIAGRLVRTYNQHFADVARKNPEPCFAKIDEAYRKKGAAAYPLKTCIVTGEPLGDSPRELVLDIREEYARRLRYTQALLAYRYTMTGRLLRFKDEAAEKAFKTLENNRAVTAEKAMDVYVQALIAAQRPSYPTKICAQNWRDTGREMEDPETGGFRFFLFNDELMILCCKTCMDKVDKDWRTSVEAVAFLHGIKKNGSPLKGEDVYPPYGGRIADPPQDAKPN